MKNVFWTEPQTTLNTPMSPKWVKRWESWTNIGQNYHSQETPNLLEPEQREDGRNHNLVFIYPNTLQKHTWVTCLKWLFASFKLILISDILWCIYLMYFDQSHFWQEDTTIYLIEDEVSDEKVIDEEPVLRNLTGATGWYIYNIHVHLGSHHARLNEMSLSNVYKFVDYGSLEIRAWEGGAVGHTMR